MIEIQYRIHKMFYDFGAGDGAFLGDMSDEKDGNSRGFGPDGEAMSGDFQLIRSTGYGAGFTGYEGLDGIHHDVGGFPFSQNVDQYFKFGFAENLKAVLAEFEAVGPVFDLPRGFLA